MYEFEIESFKLNIDSIHLDQYINVLLYLDDHVFM